MNELKPLEKLMLARPVYLCAAGGRTKIRMIERIAGDGNVLIVFGTDIGPPVAVETTIFFDDHAVDIVDNYGDAGGAVVGDTTVLSKNVLFWIRTLLPVVTLSS